MSKFDRVTTITTKLLDQLKYMIDFQSGQLGSDRSVIEPTTQMYSEWYANYTTVPPLLVLFLFIQMIPLYLFPVFLSSIEISMFSN